MVEDPYGASAGAEANLEIGTEAVIENLMIGASGWPEGSLWELTDSLRFMAENTPMLSTWFPDKRATLKLSGIVADRFKAATPSLQDVSKTIGEILTGAAKMLFYGLTIFGIYYAYKILKEIGVLSPAR